MRDPKRDHHFDSQLYVCRQLHESLSCGLIDPDIRLEITVGEVLFLMIGLNLAGAPKP